MVAQEMQRLEALLRRLEAARLADEEVHDRGGSLSERVATHGVLVR